MNPTSLSPEQLRWRCDPQELGFATTNEVKDAPPVVGQPRAVEALRFAMGMDQDGYHLFALGPQGRGKRGLVLKLFEEKAAEEPVPSDWCYVHNFQDPHRPTALELSPGEAQVLRRDMESLVEELKTALASAFESEEYHARQQEIEEELEEHQEGVFEGIRGRAQGRGLTLLRTPAGLVFVPFEDGRALSPEEAQGLPKERRKELQQAAEELQAELQKGLRQVPRWQRQTREQLKQLKWKFADLAVSSQIEELQEKYAASAGVVEYLGQVRKDVTENFEDLLGEDKGLPDLLGLAMPSERPAPLRRYRVNVLVENREAEGAPVLCEDNPSVFNLIGRLEHLAHLGALTTDFNLIKAGTLHRANGGYLILDARKLLTQPFAWEALKRALQAQQIYVESPGQMYSLISTVSLEPEPIPLRVKVALVGDSLLYYLLSAYDPDFSDLFKVAADFADQLERTRESQHLYAAMVAGLVKSNHLRPFRAGAVARVLEESARLASDSQRLSTRTSSVIDLLRESHYWAGEANETEVAEQHVQKAVDAQIYRADRLRERTYEELRRGTILIDTRGEAIGQINGLSVLQLGNFSFGRPTRITARIRMGDGKVLDIEREAKLGGPLHSKGVLILSSFLGSRYGADTPFSLAASLVFEQSYAGVEGDSASSAELYALLSAIAEAPIRQSLAVTGSVNQHGQVQAIGGVNEKIEGFFDLCRGEGLTGDQGVLIPASNVQHLMLRHEVIEAVERGEFQIYPIEHIDQGIELLTGETAGKADDDGNFPDGSLNQRVKSRLLALAERQRELSKRGDRKPEGRGDD